jgi:hypothetical protein
VKPGGKQETEEICSSETSAYIQRNKRRYNSENSTPHNHRCENLKSYNVEESSVLLLLFDLSISSVNFEKINPKVFFLLQYNAV